MKAQKKYDPDYRIVIKPDKRTGSNEAPSSLLSGYPSGSEPQGRRLLFTLCRERNLSKAEYTSHSTASLPACAGRRTRFSAKGDKHYYVATCSTLGIADDGDTVEEAISDVRKMIIFCLEYLQEERKEIPIDKPQEEFLTNTQVQVSLPLLNLQFNYG